MCDKAVEKYHYNFAYVPDRFKAQEMCNAKFSYSEEVDDIPDWFITPEMIENGGGCCDSCDDEFREWIKGYKERKSQKTQIKDELLPIAWHPDRVIDWCFDEDLEKLWGK